MNTGKKVFPELRIANNIAAAYINALMHNDDMRMLHGRIIKYLFEHEQDDVYQRDIEELLAIRRSTATTILQCMERKGLITRTNVSYDARLKKISLTDHARSIHDAIITQLEHAEKQATRGISREELEQFFAVLEKIKNNLREQQ